MQETSNASCDASEAAFARGQQAPTKLGKVANTSIAGQFDPRDLALPFIADNLAAASCFAASGASLANVGDLNGLAYTVRKAIAHLKAAAGETRDLLAATTPRLEREASNG